TENRTSGAFEQAGEPKMLFTWPVAQKMLPLVQRIVEDILGRQQQLTAMQREKDTLDRQRHTLAWPQRWRRYQLQEEITAGEQPLLGALAELDQLGVVLLDRLGGQVGFPTTVNDRRAYFSWRRGEEALQFWHFVEETGRRPIPAHWTRTVE